MWKVLVQYFIPRETLRWLEKHLSEAKQAR